MTLVGRKNAIGSLLKSRRAPLRVKTRRSAVLELARYRQIYRRFRAQFPGRLDFDFKHQGAATAICVRNRHIRSAMTVSNTRAGAATTVSKGRLTVLRPSPVVTGACGLGEISAVCPARDSDRQVNAIITASSVLALIE